MYEGRKVAIIGANSYIARNVIHQISERYPGVSLMLYDYPDTHPDGFNNYKKISILDRESLKEIDFDCDVIYLFAGKTGSANGFDDYDSFLDVNERALLNILSEYRSQKSSAKIVFPSTRLVYKGRQGLLDEDSEKEFKTIYAINKFACENYLKQYNNVFGVQYCIFRICVPYGTLVSGAASYGTAEFMLNKAKRGEDITLYGDGSQRRTFTYMEDLVDVLVEGGMSDRCVNDVYNVGGEDLSLREMAEMVAGRYGVEVLSVPWPEVALKIESGDTVFDSSKLEGVIGRLTNSTFREMILDKG